MSDPTYKEAMRAQLQERKNISPIIDAIRAGTYTPLHSTETLGQMPKGDPQARELWDKDLKVERAALQAIFITELWPFYQKNKKEKLNLYRSSARVEQEGGAETITTMALADSKAYEEAMEQWVTDINRELRGDAPSHLARAYERLVALIDFAKVQGFEAAESTPGTLIMKGFNTSATITWALVELVSRMARTQGIVLSEKEMIEAMQSAYGPLIAVFMNVNQDVSNDALTQMQVQEDFYSPTLLNSSFFILKKNDKNKWVLVLNHEALMKLRDEEGTPLLSKMPVSKTTGCPAAYTARDGVNVMQAYFDQAMEEARVEYFPYLSTP